MKFIKIKKYFLLLLLTELLFAYAPAFAQTPSPTYTGVQNSITTYLCDPTAGGSGVLYQCINQIYKFAIVAASVLGVLFIVIAGYVYMGSDGTQESVDKAKSILESTITALVILLAGYVFLYTLNPDLVQFHGNTLQPVSITAPAGGTGAGTLNSSVCATNKLSCNLTQMQQCTWNANLASGICGQESSGNPSVPSNYDHCVDGTAFTIGLFQINMIKSASGVAACPAGIFVSSNSVPVQSQCLQRNSAGLCTQWNCQLAPGMQAQYNSCVQALSDPATNISAACSLYGSSGWDPWQNSYNKCTQN